MSNLRTTGLLVGLIFALLKIVATTPSFAQENDLDSKFQNAEIMIQAEMYGPAAVTLKMLAEDGHTPSMFRLGKLHQNKRLSDSNPQEAIRWMRAAAENGFADAQIVLSGMIGTAYGGLDDSPQDALYWSKKAAEQGRAEAQWYTGVITLGVEGRLKGDQRLAYSWFKRAALQGHTDSMFRVGAAHYMGNGAPKSLTEAFFWISLAGVDGHEKALQVRDSLESELVYAERKEVERRLLNWSPTIENGKVDGFKDPSVASIASTGSGFFVSAEGHVITNQHVVDSCRSLRIGNDSNVSVVASSTEFDLALLQTTSLPDGFEPWRVSRNPVLASEIYVAGFPLQGILTSELQITDGIVSALRGPGDTSRVFQITAPIQPGNSGGPVVDASGSLIGIVVSKLDAEFVIDAVGNLPENVNFAIPAGLMEYWISTTNLSLPESSSPSESENPISVVQRNTVLIECYR